MGIGIMGTELLDAVQGNIDKLVIGMFFPAEVLGYYYLAQRVGMILIELVTTVIARVSLTTFSRLQHDLKRLNRAFRQMTFYAGVIGVLPFTLVAVFAPQVIPWAFGTGWEPSIWMLWVLAPGWGVGAIMYFDRTVLLATGNPKSAFWLAFLQNAVGVILVFALLPLGILGVLISRWARVFTWPVRLWVLKRKINLDLAPYLLQIGRCVMAALPVVLLVLFCQQTGWSTAQWPMLTFVVPLGMIGVVLYTGTLWLIAGRSNRSEMRRYIIGVRRRVLRRPAS
jgi:O-antigen/teichoic acid export membrane protein